MAASLRPHPSFTHRRAQPDANQARQIWRALADDAVRMAGGLPCQAGLDQRAARAPDLPALRGDAMAKHVDAAFRETVQAVHCAGTDDRRAVVLPLLAAAAKAVDGMLALEIDPYLKQARRVAGEREDD